jgi:hypothetical protein
LTCDDNDDYGHQRCICNELTDNTHRGDDPGNGGGVDVPGGGEPDFPPANGGGPGANPPTGPTCANGSAWQTQGYDYQNCASGAACNGVMMKGVQTCCKRAFCWCGNFDVEDAECVN